MTRTALGNRAHSLAMFDRVAIINLPERADRRREMSAQIERVGGFDGDRIAFYPATRPADAGKFESIGARGCFLSHLAVLKSARAADVERLLILEDDLDFAADFPSSGAARLAVLLDRRWDLFYGDYRAVEGDVPPEGEPLDPGHNLLLASFIGLSRAAILRAVPLFEEMLERPRGAPDYGPMHVDGAYSVLRRLNPDLLSYAANPRMGDQRSSRSDIYHNRLFDRVTLLRGVVNAARRMRSSLRSS